MNTYMNGESSPSKWPEIDTPILGPEQKEVQGGAKTLKIDEEKRSQAIKIFASLQNAVFEKQNSLNKELQRANGLQLLYCSEWCLRSSVHGKRRQSFMEKMGRLPILNTAWPIV